ncbi:hypothetical protein WDU94_012417 [Cyamophila willieti]
MVFAGKNNNIYKVYLRSEAEVNKLYENHPQIIINNKPLTVSKLVDNGYKIFLNNVEPGIPDHLLIQELTKYTKVVSQIKFVSLGSRNERFSHMIGFRRTVHVEKIENLPASFNLFCDNSILKIFIVIDKVKCYKCNTEGHLINNCPKDSVSVQERVANINKSGATNKQSSGNDGNISTFLPVFATRTATASVTPLSDASVVMEDKTSAEITSSDSPNTPQQYSQGSEIDEGSQEESRTDSPMPKEHSNEDPSMEVNESNQDKGIKRTHTDSPTSSKDKKACVVVQSNELLQCLKPILESIEPPTYDAVTFTNLIQDLKHSQKKLEIIRDEYETDPNLFLSVITKIINDSSINVENKPIYNRLRNLKKSLTVIMDSSPGNET